MVNVTEIIVSILFLLFAAILLYETKIKSKQHTEKREPIPAKLKDLQKFKITFWEAVVLVGVIVYFGWSIIFSTTYTFTDKESLSNNWDVNYGGENLKIENGCLVIEGPVELTLKASEKFHWSEIKVTPCDNEARNRLDGLDITAGNLQFRYSIGPAPYYKTNLGSIFHVGSIKTKEGTEVGTFFPTVGNLKRGNEAFPLVVVRGGIKHNYRFYAKDGFSKISLAYAGSEEKSGSGKISIKTNSIKRIKKVEVTEDLLISAKGMLGWV
jgi:hypothetical protein